MKTASRKMGGVEVRVGVQERDLFQSALDFLA
jgi:hypothetical protein